MLSDEERGRLERELEEENARAARLDKELQATASRLYIIGDFLRDDKRRIDISPVGGRSLYLKPNGFTLDSKFVEETAQKVDEYLVAVENVRRIESRLGRYR